MHLLLFWLSFMIDYYKKRTKSNEYRIKYIDKNSFNYDKSTDYFLVVLININKNYQILLIARIYLALLRRIVFNLVTVS